MNNSRGVYVSAEQFEFIRSSIKDNQTMLEKLLITCETEDYLMIDVIENRNRLVMLTLDLLEERRNSLLHTMKLMDLYIRRVGNI